MKDGRISKDILYDNLATGHRPLGRPALYYKDVFKRDFKTTGINLVTWESLAENLSAWRTTVSDKIQKGEVKRLRQLKDKRSCRKEGKQSYDSNPPSSFVCSKCSRDMPCTDRTAEPLQMLPTTRLIEKDKEGAAIVLISLSRLFWFGWYKYNVCIQMQWVSQWWLQSNTTDCHGSVQIV